MTDDESVPYDSGEWVDVGGDGRWRPSVGERMRAVVVLGVALGFLLVLSAVASVGGDDGEEDTSSPTSTSEPEVVTTTSIPPTTQLDPASLGGDEPPPACATDVAREGEPLRQRSESVVLVLNGTPRNGHAGSVSDDLDELGYSTIVPSNAGQQPTTTVKFTPGFCAESERLASELEIPGALVQPLADDSDVFLGRARILVTLGGDSL